MSELIPTAPDPARTAFRCGDASFSHAALAERAGRLARRLLGMRRVAVWAVPGPETVIAVMAALRAGVPAVPLNPKSGDQELAHVLADSSPDVLVAPPGAVLPAAAAALPRPPGPRPGDGLPPEPGAETPALVVYTSGTTGPPKGVVISRRAIAACLDALAEAWRWTARDVVVHALPLFHVHGLVLGVLGPLRRGGTSCLLDAFSPAAVTRALTDGGGTMLFGVPTMYHRLAGSLGREPGLTPALAGARLLVSGSAPLPAPVQRRLEEATGRRVIERYGMTETLMNTSVRPDSPPATGTVGPPLPGVELRLVDDAGAPLGDGGAEGLGEIEVRGPQMFSGYLNRPEATERAFRDGWFRTGDLATRDGAGGYRIVGRRSTDLIKSGGYKIGAGEVESALLSHASVAEAAVTGEPDDDLGERIIAWVVPCDASAPPDERELTDHVARELSPHKRPRQVRFRTALPRNALGKLLKRELR